MAEEQDPLRVGIVGTGFGSIVQFPGFLHHPGFEPTVLVGRHETKTKKIAELRGIGNYSTDWKKIVESDEIDAISVVTPPSMHHEMTMAALDAGKHILCEKPLASTLDEAVLMKNRSEDSGLITMVDLVFRFIPSRAHMIELIKNGYVGEIYQVDITVRNDSRLNPRTRGYNWWSSKKMGGGVLNALGSHYIDFLLQICDIQRVSARTATHIPKRLNKLTGKMKKVTADDAFVALFDIGDDQLSTMKISSTTGYGRGPRIEIYGSEGALIMQEDQSLFGGKLGEDEVPTRLEIPEQLKLNMELQDEHILVPPFTRLLDEFQKSIRSGRSLHPNFEDGVRIQQIIEAISTSSSKKKWVEIKELD
ncbi:MAG: Gfo/Idh/MocA family protein [Candidatus Kariarchaeaceae archaeon]|jgi:predicted dehydrogenase